jgi:hypothetical protein
MYTCHLSLTKTSSLHTPTHLIFPNRIWPEGKSRETACPPIKHETSNKAIDREFNFWYMYVYIHIYTYIYHTRPAARTITSPLPWNSEACLEALPSHPLVQLKGDATLKQHHFSSPIQKSRSELPPAASSLASRNRRACVNLLPLPLLQQHHSVRLRPFVSWILFH